MIDDYGKTWKNYGKNWERYGKTWENYGKMVKFDLHCPYCTSPPIKKPYEDWDRKEKKNYQEYNPFSDM